MQIIFNTILFFLVRMIRVERGGVRGTVLHGWRGGGLKEEWLVHPGANLDTRDHKVKRAKKGLENDCFFILDAPYFLRPLAEIIFVVC